MLEELIEQCRCVNTPRFPSFAKIKLQCLLRVSNLCPGLEEAELSCHSSHQTSRKLSRLQAATTRQVSM